MRTESVDLAQTMVELENELAVYQRGTKYTANERSANAKNCRG